MRGREGGGGRGEEGGRHRHKREGVRVSECMRAHERSCICSDTCKTRIESYGTSAQLESP